MKIKILLAGLLAIVLTSCSEDFLNVPSQEELTTAVYFQTEDDFQAAVNGIYATMRGWYGYRGDVGTSPLLVIGDVHSDNARYTFNPDYRAVQGVEEPADFVPDLQRFSGYWNNWYSWISGCNNIIGFIDDVDFDVDAKDNLKGQALLIRAHSYFWLLKMYGNAILHTEPVTTLEQAYSPLSSEAEVKAQIIADATEAAGLLPGKAQQEAGRVTRGTAYMLLADLHMWYGEWAEAEAALKSISGYSLVPNYADIYDPANKNNEESIWEIQFDGSSNTYSHALVYNMFPYPFSVESVEEWTGVSNPNNLSTGEQYVVPTPELIGTYEANDLRFDASIDSAEDARGWLLPFCRKYLHPHTTFRQCGENIPIYRYAETLLYLAEAVNEQGGRLSEAQGYLNQVRERAGLGNTTATNQAELRDAIMRERQVELAFEGKRWFDLVRTGNVLSVISAYGANVIADPESYYFPAGYEPYTSAFTDLRTVFNLPDDEVRVNPEVD